MHMTLVPFYMKFNQKNPAEYPSDLNEEIKGFEEAIRNTEKSITDGKYTESEIRNHLEGLKSALEKAKAKKEKK